MSTIATTNIKEPSSATNNITLTSGGAATISGLTYPTADGTAGQVLSTNGSGTLSFANNNITYSTAQSTASGTSPIQFTDVPTGVKKITIIFEDVGTSSASSVVHVQLSTSASYITTGYVSTALRVQGGAVSGDDNATAGLIVGRMDNANKTMTGAVTLHNVTGNRWIMSGVTASTAVGDQNRAWMCGGFIDVGGTIDKLQIVGHTGSYTWDNGQINVMYES